MRYFRKTLQSSEYPSGSEYAGVLNIPFLKYRKNPSCHGSEYTKYLNMPAFWIYQGSEYASGSKFAKVMNVLGFWICQDYTGFLKYLNIPDFACNHFHYFLYFLMFYQILFSPRDKRCAIIIYKRGIYELPNDLRFGF